MSVLPILASVLCCGLLVSAQQDNGHLQDAIDQQAQAIATLEARMTANENMMQEQKTTIQNQAATITALQSSLSTLQAKQSHMVGFYADMGDDGNQNYHPQDRNISANTPIVFNVALTNEGNAYNPTTGIFTAPVNGIYTFHIHFMGGAYNETTQLDIISYTAKGTRYLGMAYAQGNQIDEEDQGSGSAVTYLVTGEQVYVQSSYYDAMMWGSALSSFSGMLVHAN